MVGLDGNGPKLQSMNALDSIMDSKRFVEVSTIGIDDIEDARVFSD